MAGAPTPQTYGRRAPGPGADRDVFNCKVNGATQNRRGLRSAPIAPMCLLLRLALRAGHDLIDTLKSEAPNARMCKVTRRIHAELAMTARRKDD